VPTRFVLVRHGETDWNRDNRFQGRADPELNDAGRAQALELAEQLLDDDPFAALYTSPLRRARETAQIIGDRLALEPRTSDALLEVDVGSWSGLTRGEVEARFPDGFRTWLDYDSGWDDGETYEELARRVVQGLCDIASAHPGERVLAVTHGGPLRTLLAVAEGISLGDGRHSLPPVGNCFVARMAIRDGRVERVD
jgi:broad specificity phosphatase PhoE